MIRLWRTEWFERTPPIEEVDFGCGYKISAADLVDGHAERLTSRTKQLRSDEASVNGELGDAIDRVAPTIKPLTDLAEEVAHTLPDAEPTAYFRDTLNKALTQTHRQHHAQQILGIRPTAVEEQGWRSWFVVSFVLTVVSLSVVGFYRRCE